MGNLPLHPAIVHLPLGLAFVLPFLALGLLIAAWRGWLPGRTGWLFVGLQAILLGSGLFAMNTGEKDEENVERVVAESRIEAHEEAAEQFVWAVGLVLLVAAAGMFLGEKKQRYTGVALTVGSLVVAGLAVRVGHAGGELVYTHGAASAYTSAQAGGAGSALPGNSAENTLGGEAASGAEHDDD